jgi:hypothetical protein
MHIYGDMTEASSIDFLRRLKLASPITISKILTDNGSQFTDRFATKDKKPSGKHAFDLACAAIGAEHRLAPPRPANEWHGRTLQWPHQRTAATDAIRQQEGSGGDLAELFEAVRPTHRNARSTTRCRSWHAKNGNESGQSNSSNAFMIKLDSTHKFQGQSGPILLAATA